jgi:hypothetical protein
MVLAEVVITLLIFAVVIVMTALLFGGWLIVSIIRLIFRALGAVFSPTPPMPRRVSVASAPLVTCPNARCRSANPIAARFCRRCGVAIPTPQHVAARRAAMW